jgi:hypothetical protein
MSSSGNPIEGWIGGGAAHLQGMAGEITPAASAQRKEFKKARSRLQQGTYGFSSAQQQSAQAQGNQQVQAQTQQQQSDIARMAAAGALQGGGATEANRAVAQAAAAGAAQVAAGVQQASNAAAQAGYDRDQGIVDAQADRARQFWMRQADISMQTTQGATAPNPMGDWSKGIQKRPPPVGAAPAPTSTISAAGG